MRERNVNYFADQKDPKFSKHRIPAHRNPRYSEDDEARNIKQYGGVESEDYIHLVLGEHGSPSYMLFDRNRMLIEDYSVFRGTMHGTKIKEDAGYIDRFFSSLPPLPKRSARVMFGIDLGYTDPTIIHVLYKPVEDDPWRYLVRATMYQVKYPTQESIIDRLDSMYSPWLIGIDEGSSGKAVIQHFIADPQYKHKNYNERMLPIQFRSMIPIGLDEEGEEIQVRAKQFGMQLLQSKINNHDFCFSWKDEALISELERTTYKKTTTGEFVFTTITNRGGTRHGEDHNVAALLCAALAQYLAEEADLYLHKKRVKLYRPRWGM